MENPRALQQQAEQVQKTQNIEHTENQLATAKEEQKKAEINLDVPFVDTQIAGKIKYTGEFKRFIHWVGKGSALGQAASAAEKKADIEKDQTAEEFIEKNWKPKGGK